MGSRRSLCLLVVVVLMGWSEAYQFNVGGKEGWVLNPSENYNHWAGRMRFQVNDTLLFKYNNGSDSVLVVNKQDYDNCNTQNPITKMEDEANRRRFSHKKQTHHLSSSVSVRRSSFTAGQTPSPSPSTPFPSPTVSPSPATSSPSPSPVPSPTTTPSASPTPAPTTAPASSPPTTPSPATMSPPSPTPGGSPTNVAPPHSSAPALSSLLLFVSSVTFALLSLYILELSFTRMYRKYQIYGHLIKY
ncbi:hypothetical protein ACSBR1_038005 [Camellia fascicularis]